MGWSCLCSMYIKIPEWTEKQELHRRFNRKEIDKKIYDSELIRLNLIIREKLNSINDKKLGIKKETITMKQTKKEGHGFW